MISACASAELTCLQGSLALRSNRLNKLSEGLPPLITGVDAFKAPGLLPKTLEKAPSDVILYRQVTKECPPPSTRPLRRSSSRSSLLAPIARAARAGSLTAAQRRRPAFDLFRSGLSQTCCQEMLETEPLETKIFEKNPQSKSLDVSHSMPSLHLPQHPTPIGSIRKPAPAAPLLLPLSGRGDLSEDDCAPSSRSSASSTSMRINIDGDTEIPRQLYDDMLARACQVRRGGQHVIARRNGVDCRELVHFSLDGSKSSSH